LPAVGDLKADDAGKFDRKKNTTIENKRKEPGDQLSNLRLPEVIIPRFATASKSSGNCIIPSIIDDRISYGTESQILANINLFCYWEIESPYLRNMEVENQP
jgi:hypothetical protein